MKQIFLIMFCGMLLFGSLHASTVDKIELSYENGSVMARIAVDGPIRFMHQTEVPKNGRPYRIIVDILTAEHNLAAKNFADLPASVITGIRSSQFSVKPEKIVRIVFDMKGTPLYSITSEHNNIVLKVNDKTAKQFAVWSSSKEPKGKSAKNKPVLASNHAKATPKIDATAMNRQITNERLNSLSQAKPAPKAAKVLPSNKKASVAIAKNVEKSAVKPSALVATKSGESTVAKKTDKKTDKPVVRKVVSKPSLAASGTATRANKTTVRKSVKKPVAIVAAPPKARLTDTVYGPELDSDMLASSIDINKTVKKTVPPSVAKVVKVANVAKPASDKAASKTVKKAPSKKPVAAAKSSPKYANKLKKKKSSAVNKKAKGEQKSLASKLTSKKSKTAKPKAKLDKKSTTVASKKAVAKVKVASKGSYKGKAKVKNQIVAKKSTSRFRRSRREIKGTMVAEFPKRLVVKYRKRISRDPFSSLMYEATTHKGPVEKRVPNVEGLKLVGVIEAESGSNRALLEDKVGVSYILKSGDKVKRGYVLRVEIDRVYFQVFEYGWSRTIALALDDY